MRTQTIIDRLHELCEAVEGKSNSAKDYHQTSRWAVVADKIEDAIRQAEYCQAAELKTAEPPCGNRAQADHAATVRRMEEQQK